MNLNLFTNIFGSCLLVLSIPCGILMGKELEEPLETTKHALEAAESGYTLYLNGHKVEYDHVQLKLCSKFSVDDEHKIVYIAG